MSPDVPPQPLDDSGSLPRQPGSAPASSPIDPGLLIDQLADGVVVADADGEVLMANAAAERLFGYGTGSMTGRPLVALIPPRLRAAHQAGFTRFVTTGQGRLVGGPPLEVPALRADGSECPVELSLGALGRAGSESFAIVATLRDVTERVVLEHQALLSRYLQATVDAAQDGVIAWSVDQKVLAVNRRFCELFGLSPDTVPIGSDAVALLSGQLGRLSQPERLLAAIGWALEHPTETQTLDVELSDGRVIEGYGAPVLDEDGRQVGRVWYLRDDTERRIEEEQRRRLVEQLATVQRSQKFLLDASAVLAHTTGFAETLEALAAVAVPTMGDLCLIDVLTERNQLVRMAAVHADPLRQPLVDDLRQFYSPDPLSEHPTVQAIEHRESRWSPEMTEEFLRATTRDDRHFRLVKQLEFTSYMTVPLVAEDRPLGSVTLVSAGSGRRFSREDLALAEELADRVALVVAKERRYDTERRISHTLQTNLLPTVLPQVPGLDFAVRYLPGTLDAEVGGDFWDVFLMPSGEVALAIGDVAGHDLKAAATMAQLRSACRALRSQTDGPDGLIDLLQGSWEQLGLDRIATAAFARLDLESGRLRVASAGHPPPALIEAGIARLVPLDAAPPLGAPAVGPAVWTGTVRVGDAVVFYTDGLVEDRHNDIDEGTRRLIDEASAGPFGDSDALADHLIESLARAERSDDVALLVVQRTG